MIAALALIAAAVLVAADQIIKYFVVLYVKPAGSIEVLKGVFRFTYVENSGGAFGSFAAYTVLLTVISIVLLIGTVYFLVSKKSKSKFVNVCLILISSGGLGNIIDRIRLHYVIDFIEPVFIKFAVFNFADCLVTVGAGLLIIYLIYGMFKDTADKKKIIKAAAENGNENS